jgi:hypothetical protein
MASSRDRKPRGDPATDPAELAVRDDGGDA